MGKSINMGNNTKSTSANGNKSGAGKINTLDIIDSGLKVIDQVSSLSKTIIEEKNKTERVRIETDRMIIESNERLSALELDLQKDVSNMQKELEIYKEDVKIKLKSIDKEIEDNKGNHETTQLRLKLDHDVRMRLIDEQGKLLDSVIDIYSKYYDAILSGNTIAISPEFIFKNMQGCIDSLKHSVSSMAGQNRIINAEFTEE